MTPKITKWPFFAGDALLLGTACLVYFSSSLPLTAIALALCVLCVAAGAVLATVPFVLEYRCAVRLAEAGALTSSVAQIQKIEEVAREISFATSQWQTVREGADKTAMSVKQLSESISARLNEFGELMQRANDSEKATLRLEVEKLRRAEVDWLQVLVRMLDHVYALHQAALRSSQPGVAEQITRFQVACYDAARRIGLIPFAAEPSENFDKQRHQAANGDAAPATDARIEETLASGYTFQGKLLRPALVKLRNGSAEAQNPEAKSEATEQSQLPLDPAGA